MLLLRNADIINANICDNSVVLTASAARVRVWSMLATEPWLRCGSDPVTHLTRHLMSLTGHNLSRHKSRFDN